MVGEQNGASFSRIACRMPFSLVMSWLRRSQPSRYSVNSSSQVVESGSALHGSVGLQTTA